MEKNTWLWLLSGAAAIWYFSNQQQAPVAIPVTVSTDASGTTTAVDTSGNSVPTTYGVNAPAPGAKSPTNYSVLAVANPNLLNPNYQLADSEKAQYLANYADLRRGETMASAQAHWTAYGCSEGRIFLPMVPPSTF
jgi:hypothetical protein